MIHDDNFLAWEGCWDMILAVYREYDNWQDGLQSRFAHEIWEDWKYYERII